MNSPKKSGHCFCRGVAFEIETPFKMFSHCHCESCRKSHGAAFVSWTSVDNKNFQLISGKDLLNDYESSPGIKWIFCSRCGSSIFQTTRHSPGVIYVVAASLDEAPNSEPEGHMSFEEKVEWLDVLDDIPKFKMKTSDIVS